MTIDELSTVDARQSAKGKVKDMHASTKSFYLFNTYKIMNQTINYLRLIFLFFELISDNKIGYSQGTAKKRGNKLGVFHRSLKVAKSGNKKRKRKNVS